MPEFDADLHIHSPHSIGVSPQMTIPNITASARRKGLSVIGTGDATQPDWLNHLRSHLRSEGEILRNDRICFILTAEVEDADSVHHLIIFPDFDSVVRFRTAIKSDSPNIDHKWGGRPRVNLKGEEIAGVARDVGALVGPAHAFTPFRSIFREGKYDSLSACYKGETDYVAFVELGLSADTTIADFIPELRERTFITASDAHSPAPDKLGREFVRLELEEPSFEELKMAIMRRAGRRPVLNVGLDPRLGKYYLSFCGSCRRTLVLRRGNEPPHYDRLNVFFYTDSPKGTRQLLSDVHRRHVVCPACGGRLRLGVRDRAAMIGEGESRSPHHRPPYLHMPPLTELIRSALGVRSTKSKSVIRLYDTMVGGLGPETAILTKTAIEDICSIDARVAEMIGAYRSRRVKIVPGGGGRYGRIEGIVEDNEQ